MSSHLTSAANEYKDYIEKAIENAEALVFDCDGTLLDTMPIYYESWKRTCEPLDLYFPIERFYACAGKTVVSIFQILLEEAPLDSRARKLGVTAHDCEQIKREHHHIIEKIEGRVAGQIDTVVDIARRFHKRVPMAVASSGWRDHVIDGLQRNGLLELFDTIVTADEAEVQHPKPAPDIFLVAAKRLNVNPSKCIGFEDADLGMQSIVSANFQLAVDVRKLPFYPLLSIGYGSGDDNHVFVSRDSSMEH